MPFSVASSDASGGLVSAHKLHEASKEITTELPREAKPPVDSEPSEVPGNPQN